MKKILIVTNIPSPYRVDLFHYLQTNMTEYDIHIMFQSGNEKSFRTWSGGEEKLKNTHFLKSKVIKRTGFDQTEKFIPTGTAKVLDELCPDIVICMEYNPCAIIVKHWCNKNRIPYISWTDGTRLSEAHIGLLQKLSRKYIIRNTQAFIASSTAAKENQIYLGADPEKIYTSFLTVDIEKYKLDRQAETRVDGVFTLLFVGRVVKLKGLDLLLPVIKELKEEVHLVIAGDGPELPAVRQLATELGIEDRIEFKGYVEGEALRNCYRQADAFILPTKNDCYGLVILEAMCAGLPVISSKYADGAPDLIEEGVTGFIVDPYDPGQLKDAVTALINDPQKAETMGRSGRERSERFSFENVIGGVRDAIDLALSDNKK